MTWFKVDDKFHSHPKVRTTDPAALGLWVVAGSWVSAHPTDGFVSDAILPTLLPGATKLARKLVAAGLWERSEGGYRFHDWLDFNPSAEQENARKSAQAARQAKFRERRNAERNASHNALRNASHNGGSHGAPARPPLKGEGVGGAPLREGAPPPTQTLTSGRIVCPLHKLEPPCRGCAADAAVPDDTSDLNQRPPSRDELRAQLAAARGQYQPGGRPPPVPITTATADDLAYSDAYRQLVADGIPEPTDEQVRRHLADIATRPTNGAATA